MTKSQAIKELKGLFNNTRTINNIKVACVGWDKNQWKVIANDKSFKDITNEIQTGVGYFGNPIKTRTYKPIAEFYYQSELAEYLANNSN